ncbi:GlxA family transcriptional regulator [Microbacterium gorillae]|uniref:GlxA family transcriptional regulator n=1 Tax=Microbacterium gorillae TaxID=1231063 RepID=UPI00059039B6|nr:helix-turn-helix domain-containing protein [Microbacterium gorillae]
MRIAIYAFDGITMFHLSIPLAVFGEVARLGLADWETCVWSEDGKPVRTEGGLEIAALSGSESVSSADVLVIPSWPSELPEANDQLLELIRRTHDRGAAVVGLCLGAFAVAQAGLLDGRSAVTHWVRTADLAIQYPGLNVEPSALYIDHGDVLTSAGAASALDACVHLVRARLGSSAAATVARRLVIAPHREGGQAQYIERPVPTATGGIIGAVTDWALTRLDQPLSVEDLAQRAQMSPRNFTRRFRKATGTSPARWLLTRRLDEARRLLETTEQPISRIAEACGFVSPVTLRQNFIGTYSTTPTAYRRQFNDKETPHRRAPATAGEKLHR